MSQRSDWEKGGRADLLPLVAEPQGAGTAFGVVALSKKSDARNVCPNHCSMDKWSRASSTGRVSTVALIVGGVGVAAVAVLWFTAQYAKVFT